MFIIVRNEMFCEHYRNLRTKCSDRTFGGNHPVLPDARFMAGDRQYPFPLKRESSGAMAICEAPAKHLCNSRK